MKRINKILCMGVVTAIICSGCGNSDSGRNVKNNNSVDAVLQSEIDKSTQEEKSTTVVQSTTEEPNLAVVVQPTTEESNSAVAEQTTAKEVDTQESQEDSAEADPNVDIDISVMSSDMVYATVYQLMSAPGDYEGKTIKIKGNHYSSFYEPTGLTYHYALIQDATACCAQGLEFELENGIDYPDEDAEVTVIGTFETYIEEGYLYCALKNAVIQ